MYSKEQSKLTSTAIFITINLTLICHGCGCCFTIPSAQRKAPTDSFYPMIALGNSIQVDSRSVGFCKTCPNHLNLFKYSGLSKDWCGTAHLTSNLLGKYSHDVQPTLRKRRQISSKRPDFGAVQQINLTSVVCSTYDL